jgi:hypothetical protein
MAAAATSLSLSNRLAAENSASTRPRSTRIAAFSVDRSATFLGMGGTGGTHTRNRSASRGPQSTSPKALHKAHINRAHSDNNNDDNNDDDKDYGAAAGRHQLAAAATMTGWWYLAIVMTDVNAAAI